MKVKFDYIPETPRPKVDHIKVVDLTPAQLARCRELSFGDEGYMCEDLDEILREEQRWCYRYSQAILIYEGDQIVAWSLLQPVYRRPRYSAQFFVDPLRRGKGYGKMLLEEANRWGNNPYVYVDSENEGFFDKYPTMCAKVKEKDMAA